MISVLFVAKNSIYKTLTDSEGNFLDCWDEERDALKWPGGNPIVAHPPCRLWSMLRRFSTAPESEKQLAIWAVAQVREWSGVLEHPAYSKLWDHEKLPLPNCSDQFGHTIEIEQHWFGHPSWKKTWLYICGGERRDIPATSMSLHPFQNVFSGHGRKAKEASRRFRSATPLAFARWLIETAERCQIKQIK